MPRAATEREQVEQRWGKGSTADRLNRWLEESHAFNGEVQARSERNEKFAAGEQWPADIQRYLRQRPMLVIDEVGPLIGTMTGTAALSRMRSSVQIGDTENDLGAPLDKWILEMRRRSNVDVKERKAYRGVWVAGMGWLHYGVLPVGGKTPKFKVRNCRLADMRWDPFCVEQNLGDRSWHCEGRWLGGPAFRRTFRHDPEGKPWGFYELWKTGGSAAPGHWPMNTKNAYCRTTDEVFLKTMEWREVEPFVELYLPAELDALAAKILLLDRDVATHVDAIRAAISQQAAQTGFADPAAPQLSPPGDEQEPWQLEEGELAGILELAAANLGQKLEDVGEIVEGFEREVYYRADLVGDTVIRYGKIPEQCFTYTPMTDVMIDQARASKPTCFLDTVIHRQMAQNQIMAGALETAARAPKGAIFYQENAFVDLAQTQATIAIPGSMHAVSGVTDIRQAVQMSSGDLFQPFVQLLQMARDLQIQTTVDPYSAGAPPGGGDLRRVSSKSLSAVAESAQGKHSSRSDALKLHRMTEPEILIRQMAAYADVRDLRRILGAQDYALLMKRPDRRAWVAALDGAVIVEESEYVTRERDAAWQLMFEQGGYQQLGELGLGPPPEAFAEGLPLFFTPEMRLLWSQKLRSVGELQRLQEQIMQAQQQLQQMQAQTSGQAPTAPPQQPPPPPEEEQ